MWLKVTKTWKKQNYDIYEGDFRKVPGEGLAQ
jgi:hypothetical protein